MRTIKTAALAGLASLALAAPVAAKSPPLHTLSVALPGGGIEQIRYSGDVPPEVVMLPAPAPVPADFASWPAWPGFDQIAAIMDRDAMSLLQQVAMLAQQPVFAFDQPLAIDIANLPPGTRWCSESVAITRAGPNAAPQIVRHSAGNCAGAPVGGASAPVQATPPTQAPQRLMVRNERTPQPATVQRVAWQR
jgi:hypothetical protein